MSLAGTMAYDLAHVFFSPTEGAEEVVHLAADGTRTAFAALFSPVAVDDLGQGFVADAAEAWFARAALRRVVRGEALIRRPGSWDALLLETGFALLFEEGAEVGLETSAEESWEIDGVESFGEVWHVRCLYRARPAPRSLSV